MKMAEKRCGRVGLAEMCFCVGASWKGCADITSSILAHVEQHVRNAHNTHAMPQAVKNKHTRMNTRTEKRHNR